VQLKFIVKQNLTDQSAMPKWTELWWEAPMEGSVLNFLKAEWKVSDTGSAHWSSSPVDICIKLRIVNFWNRLISNEKKRDCTLCKIMFNLSIIDNVQFKWLNLIKSIFVKFPQSRMKGERHRLSPLIL
jgi:hypothetical protein